MSGIKKKHLELIHGNVLKILEEIGMEVGHPKLLDVFRGIGAIIDKSSNRARFPAKVVEEFLAACPKVKARKPRLMVQAAIFAGKYLDPESNEFVPLNEERIRDYFTLAKALPNINAYFITGGQWQMPPTAEPLYERLHAWKYGLSHSGIVYPFSASELILELCEAYAAMRGKTAKEANSFGVFMISPLKITAEEARQFVWWWERGFNVGVAHMTTGGISAPVTVPGLVAVNIAEEMALSFLRKACFGTTSMGFDGMLSVADMKTMIRPYGRPELIQANQLLAAMARYYGFRCFGQSGLTDAKLPSCEAGAQKVMSTLATLATGAHAMISAGTLSIDEVFSPIQMILDNEMAGALKRVMNPPEISEETIAADTICEVGPGGMFTDTVHTAEHFRQVVWEPKVWSREMLSTWEQSGKKLDCDFARELYHNIMANAEVPCHLTPDEEERLMCIIRKARKE